MSLSDTLGWLNGAHTRLNTIEPAVGHKDKLVQQSRDLEVVLYTSYLFLIFQ